MSPRSEELSEEDLYSKTHGGVWGLFGERFVATGRFDAEPYRAARRLQDLREASDYDARDVSRAEAEAAVADAGAFVTAVAAMLEG